MDVLMVDAVAPGLVRCASLALGLCGPQRQASSRTESLATLIDWVAAVAWAGLYAVGLHMCTGARLILSRGCGRRRAAGAKSVPRQLPCCQGR